MTIASLVDTAAKTAVNKLSLQLQIESWISLAKKQGADADYLRRLEQAAGLVAQAQGVEAAAAAVREANL